MANQYPRTSRSDFKSEVNKLNKMISDHERNLHLSEEIGEAYFFRAIMRLQWGLQTFGLELLVRNDITSACLADVMRSRELGCVAASGAQGEALLARLYVYRGDHSKVLACMEQATPQEYNIFPQPQGCAETVYHAHKCKILLLLDRFEDAIQCARDCDFSKCLKGDEDQAFLLDVPALAERQQREQRAAFESQSMGMGIMHGGGTMVSLKDVETVEQMVNRLRKAAAEGRKDSKTKLKLIEVMWELALKLRVHAYQCDAALAVGLPEFLAKTFLNNDQAMSCNVSVELACSILFEMCRYKQGCRAIAEQRADILGALSSLPRRLRRLPYETDGTSHRGTMEQALVDFLGRALCGLASDPHLLRGLAMDLASSPVCQHIASISEPANPADFTNLPASVAAFTKVLEAAKAGCPIKEAWQPFYTMERDLYSPFVSAKAKGVKSCNHCGKTERIEKTSDNDVNKKKNKNKTKNNKKNAYSSSSNSSSSSRIFDTTSVKMKNCARCANAFYCDNSCQMVFTYVFKSYCYHMHTQTVT